MKKKIVLASGVSLMGAALLLTTSPAIAANPARPVAAAQSPSESAAEQAKRLNAAALKAKSDAQKAKTAADAARTKTAALDALTAASSAKKAGEQAGRDLQAFLNASVPGTTTDDRVLVVQGITPAKDAVTVAGQAMDVALRKTVQTPAEQAKQIKAAALKAKADAQKAKTVADRARTKDAALKALYAGWSAKNAGQQTYRNAQAFLNAAVPGTTADDRVLVAQGVNPAKDAVSFADKAIRTATGKLKYKG
ncbi:hypothetical protein ACIBF1_08925 [Spirillospora sp. NPDC050679]